METRQRHGIPAIPPRTEEWSRTQQLGFGLVALIPAALLGATILAWALSTLGVGLPVTGEILPLLAYVHVGSQFITLLVFGHLMISRPDLSGGAKLMWGIAFLFMAPAAIPVFWLLHVWRAEEPAASEGHTAGPHREVHVYDFDYTEHRPQPVERREDGAIVHHVDVPAS